MSRTETRRTIMLATVAGFVGGVLASSLFGYQPVLAKNSSLLTRVVTAEEFRVVDQEGRVRASLGTEPSLLSRLALYDPDGNIRASLSLNAVHETAGLFLYAKGEDSHSVSMKTQPDGLSSLSFHYKSTLPGASLGNLFGEEIPAPSRLSLKFYDNARDNKVIWRAP
jgi:hypothetical protein